MRVDRISFSPHLLHVPGAAALGATDKYFPDSAGAMSAMFNLVEEPASEHHETLDVRGRPVIG